MRLRDNMATASSSMTWRVYLPIFVVFLALFISSVSCKYQPRVEVYFQGKCSKENPICHHLCVELSEGGFECACKDGYQLHDNGFSCVEISATARTTTTVAPVPVLPDEDEEDAEVPDMDLDNEDVESLQKLADNQEFKSAHSEANSEQDNKTPVILPEKKSTSIYDKMQGDGVYNSHYSNHYRSKSDRKNRKKGRKKHRKHIKNKSDHDRHNQKDTAITKQDSREELHNVISGTGAGNSNIRFHTCSELTCQARGKCVKDVLRGGVRCQCKLGTEGDFCERDVVVRYPKLMGNGYIAFPVLRNAYKQFTINIEFKPDTMNGLLLFSSDHPAALYDFFSIALSNGFIEFRFDCGSGPALLRSKHKVKMGDWNKLMVQRDLYNGWIKLNNEEQVRGRSMGALSRIAFKEDLYLGGYRNTSMIGPRTGMQWGFVGCVRFLEVNNKVYDMRRGAFVGDAIHGVDVGDCSSHMCDDVTCKNGGTCAANSADTHICLCPLGFQGDKCEEEIDMHVPSFGGHSYLQYVGLQRTVLSYTDIEIVFKPMDRDGLVLYNGYTTDRSGDFISLAMVDGYLEYRFDLGTGPAIIRSKDLVALNEWHLVKISRTGRDGYMEVDSQPIVEGMSRGAFTQLTLTQDMFIGGHRNFDEVAKHAGVRDSYRGCIQKVVVNDRPMKLLKEALNGVNVFNCEHPCKGNPCLNGGKCIPEKEFYKCSCPLGYENTNCEDRKKNEQMVRRGLDTTNVKVPMFSGISYLLFTDKEIMERVWGNKIEIEIRLRATGPDGVIFWTGESDMMTSSDYLAIGLVGGHIRYSYNLGSGEVQLMYNRSRLDDGKWHKIKVQRYERIGYLEIDGTEVIEAESPGRLTLLNTNANVYLGGVDDVVHKTLKKYTSGFVGCISSVTLATDYKIDLLNQADDGQNVQQCV